MKIEERLKQLNIVLPPAGKPVGSYHPAVFSDRHAFLSGQLPRGADGALMTGRLGKELNIEQGKAAARAAALNVLSVIKNFIGFEKIEKFLRVCGYVQASPDFYEHSQVVNGASDLFLEVFGEKGIHARTSVGMASLPLNAAVEIEVTLLLK